MTTYSSYADLWQAVEKEIGEAVEPGTRWYFERENRGASAVVDYLSSAPEDQEVEYKQLVQDVKAFKKAVKTNNGEEPGLVAQPRVPSSRWPDPTSREGSVDSDEEKSQHYLETDRQQLYSYLLALDADVLAESFRSKHLRGTFLQPAVVDGWLSERSAKSVGKTHYDDRPVIDWFRGWMDFGQFDPWGRIDRAEEGTVLSELRSVSGIIAMTMPWMRHQAAWFVLTGEAPYMRRVQFSIKRLWGTKTTMSYAYIQLTVDPEATNDEVIEAYKNARSEVRRGERSHPLGDKKLALAAFVLENARVNNSNIGNWSPMRSKWNRLEFVEQRNWAYFDTQAMRNDYNDAISVTVVQSDAIRRKAA